MTLPPNLDSGNINITDLDQENLFGWPKMDNFVDVFSVCCSTALIFGGLIPYIPQYLKIKHSMTSEGFSTYVCLTLLLANILRIMFWFGHHFKPPLLIQSFVMIAGMLAMMEICVRVRDKGPTSIISSITYRPQTTTKRRSLIDSSVTASLLSSPQDGRPNDSIAQSRAKPMTEVAIENSLAHTEAYHEQHITFSKQESSPVTSSDLKSTINDIDESPISSRDLIATNSINDDAIITTSSDSSRSLQHRKSDQNKWLSVQNFWNWDDFTSYLKFLMLFTIVMGLITHFFIHNELYVESLGFVALFTESMLGMPQLMRNYLKKSTRGMSVEMVIMWLPGDLFKTLYSILNHLPFQFVACNSIQVAVDILILIQVLWYKRPNVVYRKLPKST